MKISVIIPTYRPKDYLWDCLNSLVNQTFHKNDFEVILVLNGCEEPYKTEIEKFISTEMVEMNVNFIHTLQGGVSNARNIALDQAKGEYITFIDDDDFISTSCLSELYEKASSDTISLCYPYAFKDGDMNQLSYRITNVYNERFRYGRQTYTRTRKYFSGPCMKLIPMSFIQGRRFNPNFKNGEDTLFMFLISDRIKYVNFTSKNAVYYRRVRLGSATSTITTKDNICNLFRLINEYTKIYIGGIFRYDSCFYLTRVLGAIRSIICK